MSGTLKVGGNIIASHSGVEGAGEVTLQNATLDSGVVFPALGNSAVGTVSESSGAPTGDIIERGSNANGEYVKYADGTLICWGEITAPADGGTGAKTGTWTFPSEFIDTNRKVFCNFRFNSNNNMNRIRYLHPVNSSVSTTSQIIGWHEGAWEVNDLGTSQPIMLQAIGRWY
jgi:hypothetical protein